MKKVYNKGGFTLVELIIVITILAILGTIGFVSFQGYTADARDTKRTSDLSSLISALEAKRAGNSLNLTSFVSTGIISSVTGTILSSSGIAGKAVSVGDEYKAGIMNFSLLGVSAESFKDPNGVDYSFGATSLKGGSYQFAATLEKGENPIALVKGNYQPRIIEEITVIPTSRNKKVLEIKNPIDFTKILVQDTISNGTTTCWTSGNAVVQSISNDLRYITINIDANTTGECKIKLAQGEMNGLIGDYSNKSSASEGTPVIDGSGATLPY